MKRLWLFAIGALIITLIFCIPVSAKIQFTPDVIQYDASGTTNSAFGEEVHVALVISPGETEVKNLVIELKDGDALIDDTNPRFISLTAFPAGTSVPITQNGKTFTVSSLQPGQTIILAFNAYPKTLQQPKLHVADIEYSYTQLGDRIASNLPIDVRMDDSAWFLLIKAQNDYAQLQQKTKSSDAFSSNVFFGSIVLIIIAIIVIVYSVYKRYKFGKAARLEKEKKEAQIKELIKTADSAADNQGQMDLLKAKLRDELGADTTSSGLGIDEDQDEQREKTTKMKIE